jgi:protein-tyrosine phosphatase
MADLLFVCTANVCRSPLAERLLRRRLEALSGSPAAPVSVASAGARARRGTSMPEEAARVLRARGGDGDGFTSTPLTASTVGDPALVLTAERWHRRAVTEAAPRLVRRCFTLLELARLLDAGVPGEVLHRPLPERLTALAEVAAARRGSGALVRPELDDLPDPLGGTAADFEACADRIEDALSAVVEVLGAP